MEQNIKITVPEGHELVETKTENGISYSFVKIQDNKDAEDFLFSLLNELTIKLDKEYPNSVFYHKDGELLFELEKRTNDTIFWCEYSKVWGIFQTKYGLNYQQTKEFIKVMVENHLKISGVTPPIMCWFSWQRWKGNLE